MNPIQGEAPRRIRRLEEAVVNRIAAGEVIQRPASALKELMENSLDAGATSLNVVVKDGGLKMIQITDNGHGIQVEDLHLLCERHTTSKLREYDDLQSISTMGFRGEALASMSFVSHLSVTTMTAGQPHGYRASYKDGKMEGPARPCAAVQGTQITVEDLFYNVAARKKAFKNPSEEYSRMLDVVARFAVHWRDASFSVKKHGESRGDIHTSPCGSVSDSVGAVYGPTVARELLPLTVCGKGGEGGAVFECEGMVSSANYSAKKATFILFINHRLVECSALRRSLESLYATLLPKASKPFLLLSLTLPPADVDVNVHPTKREVSFLHQESLVGAIQVAVEEMLKESNISRTFYTQTLLTGTQETTTPLPLSQTQTQTQPQTQTQSRVRVDASQPQGSLLAYMPLTATGPELVATRKAVRQRRNPAESAELSSVRELIGAVEKQTHSGLQTLLQGCSFVGMADDTRALVQHQTHLYLADVSALSTEVVYQQVLRRFAHFATMRLSTPAPLTQLVQLALEDEEQAGRWCPDDGPQEEIARINTALLVCKAEMLREYFGVEVSAEGDLTALPLILDHYTPDLDRLPAFVLALGNNVEWESEKECFDSVAAALADLYAMHPPMVPKGEGEVAWAQREWTIQHLLFPALKFFLTPPKNMATNGTIVQVASLEKLYKVFERC